MTYDPLQRIAMVAELPLDQVDDSPATGKVEVVVLEGSSSATPKGLAEAKARARVYQIELFEQACKQNVRLPSCVALLQPCPD